MLLNVLLSRLDQTRDAAEELVPADDDKELQIKASEGGKFALIANCRLQFLP